MAPGPPPPGTDDDGVAAAARSAAGQGRDRAAAEDAAARRIDLTGSGPRDANGHGTTVAGVIAAHAKNGVGGAGVCWSCSILPIKVMNADGKGDLATVAQGIVRATNLGADVIDLSLGGPTGLDALKQAVDYATAKASSWSPRRGTAGAESRSTRRATRTCSASPAPTRTTSSTAGRSAARGCA